MSDRNGEPAYPGVEAAITAIAAWINKHRLAAGRRGELSGCSPDDVRDIARDIGVPVNELATIVNAGPGSARLLEKMLAALKVDSRILIENPAVLRDLQRVCTVCAHKGQCEHELAEGSAAGHFHDFCPNADTLGALVAQRKQ